MPRGGRTTRKQTAEPAVRTVSFVSLGCPKNLVDSEKMLGLLAEDGLIPVSYDPSAHDWGHDDALSVEGGGPVEDGIEPADAVVINTCGFLEAAKQESLGVIRDAVRAKQRGLVKRVIVAGCLVQRHRAKMLDWAPGIDAMIGVFDRDRIVEAVRGAGATRVTLDEQRPPYWIAANALQAAKERGRDTVGLTVNGKDGKGVGYFEDDSARLRLTPRHYAYLRISEGCNQNCAFCTIPSIRGKMRSKPVERCVAEARELLNDGAFELNLIGQDTTSYGDDLGRGWRPGMGRFEGGLPALLDALDRAAEETAGSAWIRLMYAYPSNFRDEFIDAFADLCARGRILPYIDIPLQHASDRMLAAMRRNVTADQQRRLIRTLRERVPGIAIRTTFISGFPGETEDDHRDLLAFVEASAFDAVGVFEYSREEGTPAGTMEADPALAVAGEVKTRRKAEVLLLQQRIAFERAAALAAKFDPKRPTETGERLDLLVDGQWTMDNGQWTFGSPDSPPAADPDVHSPRSTVHCYRARARFQAPQIDAVTYVVSDSRLSPGEVVRCVVVGSAGYDLIARPVADLDRRVPLAVVR